MLRAHSIDILVVHVIEKLNNILDSTSKIHTLEADHKLLLREMFLFLRIQDPKKMLISEVMNIFYSVKRLHRIGQKWVDETFFYKGDIDTVLSHKVDQILISALKLAIVVLPDILKDVLSLDRGQNDAQLLQGTTHT